MPMTVDQFTQRLTLSGVMSEDAVRDWVAAIPIEKRPSDGEALARELVKQKKLTKFQAEQLYAGKEKTLVLGNYVILDKLGQGGMGMVLKAEHKRMKRLVALKVMSPAAVKTPDALKRFHREVEAAARLTHPNIVNAFDADEAKGTHFLVMEYVEGSDLSAVVKKTGPLEVDIAIDCLIQAARGLEFAHKQGVVHRDIKPANLLLDKDGTVKILDMGLARIEANELGAQQADLTSTGAIMGTIDYMSPEQAEDTKHADARSDIYSLGCSLYYLLTGQCTFQADTVMRKLLAHRNAPLPVLSRDLMAVIQASANGKSTATVDARLATLDAVFHRMIAKRPTDRFQSMTEVIAALEQCRSGNSPTISFQSGSSPGTENPLQSFLRAISEDSPSDPKMAGASAASQRLRPAVATDPNTEATMLSANGELETDPQTEHSLRRPSNEMARTLPNIRGRLLGRGWGIKQTLIAATAAVVLLGAVVFFIPSNRGTLRVEINDPEIEVTVQGTDILVKDVGTEDLRLKPGKHTLHVKRGELEFDTDAITLKKGETIALKIERVGKRIRAMRGDKLLGNKEPSTSMGSKMNTGSKKNTDLVLRSASPNGSSGTGTQTAPAGKYALRFDGSGQTVEATGVPYRPTTVATIEAWLTCEAELQGTTVMIAEEPNGCLRIDAPNRTLQFYTFHGEASASQTVPSNRRFHLAGVNNGRQRLLFLDGKLIGKTDDAGTLHYDIISGKDQPFKLKLGDGPFRGTIDTARFSSVARYEKEFMPPSVFAPDKETVALYLFNEGQGDILKDSSANGYHGKINGAKWVTLDGSAIETPTVSPKPTVSAVADVRWPFDPQDGSEYEWSEPENLGPKVNDAKGNRGVTLTADQLCLIAGFDAPGKSDLREFHRASINDPWGDPIPLTGADFESDAGLSADGLTLLFSTNAWKKEAGQGGGEIWMRQRSNREAAWGPPQNLGAPINSPKDDSGPALSPDGLMLAFHSNREGGSGDTDLWISRRTALDAPWGPPQNLGPKVNSAGRDEGPQFLADGKNFLFFRGTALFMTATDAQRNYDLVKLPKQTVRYTKPWLSPDGRTLYFHSQDLPGGQGGYDIWLTRRVAKQAASVSASNIPGEALTFGGHRYLLGESFGTWVEAKAKAEATGGHLATINSRAERDWILENVWRKRPNQDGGKMFLGGIHRGGSWSWVTDEPFDPSLWLGQIPAEPSLALAWASDTSWNHLPPDDPNARFAYFLVEWDTLGPAVGKNNAAAAGSVSPDVSDKAR